MKACAVTQLVSFVALLVAGSGGCGGAAQSASPAEAPSAASAPPEEATPPSDSTGEGEAPAASATAPAKAAPEGDTGPDTRTTDGIATLVKAHRKEARACYEKALKEIPGLKGDLVIHFTLTPEGKVKDAEVNMQRSTITNATVARCVMDVIRAIPFPASSKGMETAVNYPFNFNP